eukprot:UC4_evm1s1212
MAPFPLPIFLTAAAAAALNPVYVSLSNLNNTTSTSVATVDVDPRWFLISQPDGVTEAIGIAFANEREGFLAGGANGVGAEILKSTDGAKSWKNLPGINFGLDILLLDAEAAKSPLGLTSCVVTSVFGELYSLN